MSDEDKESKNETHDLAKEATENIVVIHVNEFTSDSFKDFREEFERAQNSGQTIVPIVIDSYGGEVHTVLPMIDLIKSSKLPVATIAVGKAMSAGAFLLGSGTKGFRWCTPSSTVMIHQVTDVLCGRLSDIKSDAKQTERLNNLLFNKLDVFCDKQLGYWMSQVKDNMSADVYLTAEQAKEHGLVDVVGVPRIRASVKVMTVLENGY